MSLHFGSTYQGNLRLILRISWDTYYLVFYNFFSYFFRLRTRTRHAYGENTKIFKNFIFANYVNVLQNNANISALNIFLIFLKSELWSDRYVDSWILERSFGKELGKILIPIIPIILG